MRIVGSMTTLPSRISKIKPVIQSLIKQRRSLDKIYINIPWKTLKGHKYIIPFFLSNMESNIIVINRCKDYGPITKLLPTLDKETDPDTYIITFDDDNIVHKDVVKIFEKKIKQYPKTCLSFSGWNIGRFPWYYELHYNNKKDIEVDWVQGCHGIAYPRGLIDKNEILTCFSDAPNILSHHDDHKISAYLTTKNIKKISIKGNAKQYFVDTNYRTLDCISGANSLTDFFKFLWEVISIGWYFKGRRLYYHSEDITASIFFKLIGIIILILLIIIFIPGWIYKILSIGVLITVVRIYFFVLADK